MTNSEKEIEFLNFIFKNAEMGLVGINNILPKVQNEKFKKVLNAQLEEYHNIKNEAENILKKYGKQPEEVGVISKVTTKIVSEVELIKEITDEKIAKMMMEGTNKGIIATIEKINNYNNKDAEILVLANKLKDTMENNTDDLKKFL